MEQENKCEECGSTKIKREKTTIAGRYGFTKVYEKECLDCGRKEQKIDVDTSWIYYA